MKKVSIGSLAIILLLAATSCSKISDGLTVDVPVDVPVELTIPAGSELKSNPLFRNFYASEELDIAKNPTVLEYEARIKSIAATGGRFRFILPASSPKSIRGITINSLTLKVTNLDTNVVLGTWSLTPGFYVTAADVEIGAPTSGSMADISAALDAKAKVKIEVYGRCDIFTAWDLTYYQAILVKARIV